MGRTKDLQHLFIHLIRHYTKTLHKLIRRCKADGDELLTPTQIFG